MGGQLQLNALPAPPPLSVGLTINDAGGVDSTSGLASVSGSIICSRPVVVSISGQLKQDHAQSSLTGKFGFVVACDGATDWTTTVVTAPGVFQGRAANLFVAGRASVSATATAVDQDLGDRVAVQQRGYAYRAAWRPAVAATLLPLVHERVRVCRRATEAAGRCNSHKYTSSWPRWWYQWFNMTVRTNAPRGMAIKSRPAFISRHVFPIAASSTSRRP